MTVHRMIIYSWNFLSTHWTRKKKKHETNFYNIKLPSICASYFLWAPGVNKILQWKRSTNFGQTSVGWVINVCFVYEHFILEEASPFLSCKMSVSVSPMDAFFAKIIIKDLFSNFEIRRITFGYKYLSAHFHCRL